MRGKILDEDIETFAVVGQLSIEGNDALGQPDRLVAAGTEDGIFFALTPLGDYLELAVRQRFTRIKPEVDGP
ncbi:hypothetical protein MHAS44199_23950 [Mycolicibacterium hassiacum DSM 44199]|nr:hypothetical protein [Mycolicibacterium hassiacum DSM 44199]